ncbi:MAG: glycosyltransferase family 4 protein [Thermoproteota archaeon]|nr:glycosyltransferase family 4 protein [Candidatus Brockarchaeota archaeon]
MKILVVAPKTSGIGGIAYHVSKLMEHLSKRGNHVDKISTENVPFINIKNLINPSFMFSASLKSLMIRLRGERYDIVHAHNLPSALPMKLFYCRRVLTLHGVYSEQISSLHGRLFGRIARDFEKRALKWADAFSVVSKSTEEFYKRLGFNPLYIPNAIDFDDIPKERVTLYENQVAYVGRLSYEKGVDLLVEVARRLPEANFVLIGDGPLYIELLKASEKVRNLHLLGYKPRDEALKHLAGSRVFILPSRSEGLSTSILEAMALKIPVVATNVGGNSELVQSEATGFLVEKNDVDSMAYSVRRTLEENVSSMTLRAYDLVMNNYNWNVVIESYLKLYRKLLP